jgi:hypothetical protein
MQYKVCTHCSLVVICYSPFCAMKHLINLHKCLALYWVLIFCNSESPRSRNSGLPGSCWCRVVGIAPAQTNPPPPLLQPAALHILNSHSSSFPPFAFGLILNHGKPAVQSSIETLGHEFNDRFCSQSGLFPGPNPNLLTIYDPKVTQRALLKNF